MNDIDIMEQNLAKLLNQHLSLPTADSTEPADPFQKRTFGKKMRKSAVSIIDQHRTASLGKFDSIAVRSVQHLPQVRPIEKETIDEEGEMYLREIEVLMARLKVGMQKVEQNCRQKLEQIVRSSTGRQRQQKAESLLSQIETSVDFITNDCFNFQHRPKDKENRHDRDNRETREVRQMKEQREVREMRQCREMKDTRKTTTGNSRARPHQKSIYQSVLEQRKMRLSKKRMI